MKVWSLREWNKAHGGKQPEGVLPDRPKNAQNGTCTASQAKRRVKGKVETKWNLGQRKGRK